MKTLNSAQQKHVMGRGNGAGIEPPKDPPKTKEE